MQFAGEPAFEWLQEETEAGPPTLACRRRYLDDSRRSRAPRSIYAVHAFDEGKLGGRSAKRSCFFPKATVIVTCRKRERPCSSTFTAASKAVYMTMWSVSSAILEFDLISAEDAPQFINAGMESLKNVDPQHGRHFVTTALGYCLLQAKRLKITGDVNRLLDPASGRFRWVA